MITKHICSFSQKPKLLAIRSMSKFFIYTNPNEFNPKTLVKYIGRYHGRPVIVTSRIVNYDGMMAQVDEECLSQTC